MPIPGDDIEVRLDQALAGRYRIRGTLGRGGMATVYLARDLRHDRDVALKVLEPDLVASLGAERFLNEIGITARLQHVHILTLIDSGEAAGRLFYVMPYVAGESLRQRLTREGPLPLAEAAAIVRNVASALDHAHRQGIIHRDIKPENIFLQDGEAVVADFGIALALSAAAEPRLTRTGVVVGTPAYMSPEQVTGERELDGRSDLYALGCVLFEMLTGEVPHAKGGSSGMLARRVAAPPSARRVRPEVTQELDEALRTALAPTPGDRFDTVGDFAAAVEEAVGRRSPSRLRPWAVAAVVAVAALAAGAVPLYLRVQREQAREAVRHADALAGEGRYAEAYGLAVSAEGRLRGDTVLSRVMARVADHLTILSEPAAARVRLQRFAPDSAGMSPPPFDAGLTPIHDLRVARGDYRVVVEKEGYEAVERLASSELDREELAFAADSVVRVQVDLPPEGRTPSGMVAVPGGAYELVSPDAPSGMTADLDAFWMDRYEVDNEQFRALIRDGGYASPGDWSALLRDVGADVPFERAVAGFTDRTGLPGPRAWVSQDFAEGEERLPVTGVTWYEAAAFCAHAGKRLPTVFEWEKAARAGVHAHYEGTLMPWGYAQPHESSVFRANFNGDGPRPVDDYPFGIGPFGAYNLAGNVKEWTANAGGDGFVVSGGSWEDPVYLFGDLGTAPARTASRALGFRCARTRGEGSGDQGASRTLPEEPTPEYHPIDSATFRALLTHYRYDRHPLDARVVDTVSTADWLRQKVAYRGVDGDTVLAYLYLPVRASEPYQVIVYLPSSSAFSRERVSQEVEWALGPNIKAGRAVFAPVLKGMLERPWGSGYTPPEPSSVRYRDEMVLHATEMRLGLDYLVTRSEVDTTRLAYVGLSWSAGSHLPFAAVDDRFKAVVLIGGGIDERLQPTLPEASNINFAPWIRPPKLLLNGRRDEEHPWLTRALPLWNLLREPKELVLVEGAGHVPPLEDRVPAIQHFLDEVFGPVRTARPLPQNGGSTPDSLR